MWYTDDQLAAIPALSALGPSRLPEIADAAGRIYAYVQGHAGVADGDLRAWAETAGIDPETYNAALGVLRETGRAVRLDASPVVPPTALGAVPGTVSGVLTEAFTAKDLAAAAKRIEADVAASATKEEHAAAIVEAVLAS